MMKHKYESLKEEDKAWGKLHRPVTVASVADMIKVMVRREEEYAEIETHQESILQVNTIHHQLMTKEEKS